MIGAVDKTVDTGDVTSMNLFSEPPLSAEQACHRALSVFEGMLLPSFVGTPYPTPCQDVDLRFDSYGHCIGKLDILIWSLQRRESSPFRDMQSKGIMEAKKSEVLQGTLDLIILKTLHALGPLHGFGIARRIEQVSHDIFQLNEGTVYTSLLRMQQQGWIAAEWGISENNRKAKYYSITERGLKQLEVETENWKRISGVIGRVLRLVAEG